MAVPSIWKNNYVEGDSSTDPSPGSALGDMHYSSGLPTPALQSQYRSQCHPWRYKWDLIPLCSNPSIPTFPQWPSMICPVTSPSSKSTHLIPWHPFQSCVTSMLFFPCSRHTWTSGPLHWFLLLSGTTCSRLTAWHGLLIITISGRPSLASPCKP